MKNDAKNNMAVAVKVASSWKLNCLAEELKLRKEEKYAPRKAERSVLVADRKEVKTRAEAAARKTAAKRARMVAVANAKASAKAMVVAAKAYAKAVKKAEVAVAKVTAAIAKAKRLSDLKARHENADLGCMVDAVRGTVRVLRKEDRERRAQYALLKLYGACKAQHGTEKSVHVSAAAKAGREAIRGFVGNGCKPVAVRAYRAKENRIPLAKWGKFCNKAVAEANERAGMKYILEFADVVGTDAVKRISTFNNVCYFNAANKKRKEKEGLDVKFKFDLQLFAEKSEASDINEVEEIAATDLDELADEPIAHRGNTAFIRALVCHEKNAMCYKVTLLPSENKGEFYTVLDAQQQSVTPLSKPYLTEDGYKMTTISGREIIAERALDGVLVVDYNPLVLNKKVDAVKDALKNGYFLIGKVNGRKKRQVFFEQHSKRFGEVSIFDCTRTLSNYKGKNALLDVNLFYTQNGKLRKGFTKYEASLFSSGQCREQMITQYTDKDKFRKNLNDATYGESELTFNSGIEDATGKQLADKCNRIGSKQTRMGSLKTKVHNVLIWCKKNPECDGTGLILDTWVARAVRDGLADEGVNVRSDDLRRRVRGYLLQIRPLTVKGTGLTISQMDMNVVASKHSIYTIDLENIKEIDELVFYYHLDKTFRCDKKTEKRIKEAFAGKDAIGIVGDKTCADWDLYGDLNFFKDAWDLRKTTESGLNVIATAHYEADRKNFKGCKTNGQFMKCLMMALAENTNDSDFCEFSKNVIMSIIDENVKAYLTLERHPEVFTGKEPINTSYESGAYMLLNPEKYIDNYSIVKNLLTQRINAMNKMLNDDAYKVPGHNGMITVDIAWWFTGKSFLKQYMDNGRSIIEVFDPVFEAYYKAKKGMVSRYGVGLKNPSMGTREFALIKYVSLAELKKRIKKSGVKYSELIIKSLASFKEGGVMLPDDLENIALIIAGSDEDGDKLILLFSTKEGYDLVAVMWRSKLKPRAVGIGAFDNGEASAKESSAKFALDENIFNTYAVELLSNGNRGVGTVTVTGSIFSNLYIMLKKSPNSAQLKMFAEEMFKALGCVSKDDKKGKDYESVVNVRIDENGHEIFETPKSALNDFFEKRIKGVRLTDENIFAMLDDLDVLDRHTQELTIDAQKKFYQVYCDWISLLYRFAVVSNKEEIKFKMSNVVDGNDGGMFFDKDDPKNVFKHVFVEFDAKNASLYKYVYKDERCIPTINLVETLTKKKKDKDEVFYYIADSFTAYKLVAAKKMLKKFEELAKTVNKAADHQIEVADENEESCNFVGKQLDREVEILLKTLDKKAKTINQVWVQSSKNRDKYLDEFKKLGYTTKLLKRLESDMRRFDREDFCKMTEALSNEVRQIVAMNKLPLSAHKVSYAVDTVLAKNKVRGNLVRAERFVRMCEESEKKEQFFGYKFSKIDAAKLVAHVDTAVEARGGLITLEDGVALLEAPLMDGVYYVKKNTAGEIGLVRAYADFVEIPEVVENEHVINAYTIEEAAAIKADELIKDGVEVKITFEGSNAFIGTEEEPKLLNVTIGNKSKLKPNDPTTQFTLNKKRIMSWGQCGIVKNKIVAYKCPGKAWITSDKGKKEYVDVLYWNFAILIES